MRSSRFLAVLFFQSKTSQRNLVNNRGAGAQGELEILECLVSVQQGRLFMRHRNKNAVAVQSLFNADGHLNFKKVVPYATAVPAAMLVNTAVGMLHRIEMNTSAGDWRSVLSALMASEVEYTHLGYPKFFLLKCLKRALPSLSKKDVRWLTVATVFSYCLGAQWRPWLSVI